MSPADGWWRLEPLEPLGGPQNRERSPAHHTMGIRTLWELSASLAPTRALSVTVGVRTQRHSPMQGWNGGRWQWQSPLTGLTHAVTVPGSRRRAEGEPIREAQS